MLDPIVNAVEVWLAINAYLPLPITALISLSLGFFLICVIFHLIYKIRS